MLSETSADAAQHPSDFNLEKHQWMFRYGFRTMRRQKNVRRSGGQCSIDSYSRKQRTAGYRLLSGN
jgi:hypothetical protein